MPSASRPPRRLPECCLPVPVRAGRHRFAGDERGAVAVEFAILAIPFFALIFAILETALVFFAGQILDSAVQDASRKIRTGQAVETGWNVDNFRTEICDGLYGLFDCDEVKVKVTVVNNFASAQLVSPIDPECEESGAPEDCEWVITETYDGGTGRSIVLVQAHYKWPVVIELPGMNHATQAGGKRLMSAARVFQNEPF